MVEITRNFSRDTHGGLAAQSRSAAREYFGEIVDKISGHGLMEVIALSAAKAKQSRALLMIEGCDGSGGDDGVAVTGKEELRFVITQRAAKGAAGTQ